MLGGGGEAAARDGRERQCAEVALVEHGQVRAQRDAERPEPCAERWPECPREAVRLTRPSQLLAQQRAALGVGGALGRRRRVSYFPFHWLIVGDAINALLRPLLSATSTEFRKLDSSHAQRAWQINANTLVYDVCLQTFVCDIAGHKEQI